MANILYGVQCCTNAFRPSEWGQVLTTLTGLGQADRPDQRPGFARAGSEKFRFGTEPWQLQ
jgi:hypothetical protein